jgi:hypothetical protein
MRLGPLSNATATGDGTVGEFGFDFTRWAFASPRF